MAFAQIIDKYKQSIFTFLYRMTGQQEDARDLAQEVFTKAYFHLNSYKPACKFWTWLYRIAYNHCVDELRRRRRTERVELTDGLLTHRMTPESVYLAKEQTAELEAQVLALPQEYRTVFLLRHTQQLSCQEISEILDIPVNLVRVRLHRARKKLRERLLKGGAMHEVFDI
ncbi:RNA polymerase sigma factor [Brevibacillus borstelensis]|uniref:RNA polymerase sigma factor n=1 Tax=Brevibacillus borstelensis TaxID=45462 RepID=UPI0030C1221E